MILFLKALHIVGFVSWFAGLFYLVRMFVYHVEATKKPQPERDILVQQFNIMEWRVYRIICNPAMLITMGAGLGMLALDLLKIEEKGYFIIGAPGWMWVKLVLLALMLVYHFYSRKIILRLEQGAESMTSHQFRLLNEVPTLLLVAITFIAVYGKAGTLNYGYLLLGMVGFIGLLMLGVWAYKKSRERRAAK